MSRKRQEYYERMSRAFRRDPNGTLAALNKKQADMLIEKLNRLGGAP